MNEQLLKIAKRAGLTLSVDQQVAFQRAAELIVKECMTVARGADGMDATHEAWYLIEQHFGVEE